MGYHKCQDRVVFQWYGPPEISGFKSFLDTNKQYYVGEQNGFKYYQTAIGERKYQFSFKRILNEKGADEIMTLTLMK